MVTTTRTHLEVVVEVDPAVLRDADEEGEEGRLKVTEARGDDLAEKRDARHGEDEQDDEQQQHDVGHV